MPPYVKGITDPFHVPVVMVPSVVIELCPTYVAAISTTGSAAVPEIVILSAVPLTLVTVPDVGVDHEGIPAANVKTSPFVPADRVDKVLAADANRISPVE